jgi:hypothetical protein
MKTDNISKRIAALEGEQKREEDLVCFTFQWMHGDTPTSEPMARWLSQSEAQKFRDLFKLMDERDELEKQHRTQA